MLLCYLTQGANLCYVTHGLAPGALNRVIDRGTRGINWTLSSMVFNVVPTVFEVAMVSAILTAKCGASLAALTCGTVGAYMVFTFSVTQVGHFGFDQAQALAVVQSLQAALLCNVLCSTCFYLCLQGLHVLTARMYEYTVSCLRGEWHA
jgi:hypothetical protein